MTKTILATLATLAALVYSPAFARTDLTDDYTDFPLSHVSSQQERYAARTEYEAHNYAPSSPAGQKDSTAPPKLSLQEKIQNALQKDCGRVRLENNEVICEDKVKCTKNNITDQEYQKALDAYQKEVDEDPAIGNEYYSGPWPPSPPSCIEWQMRERWRFNPQTIGKVEALLIDTQKIEDIQQPLSLGYALRTVGKNALYPVLTESTAREVRGLLNYGNYSKGGK